ncbi:MFS transporter [Streptomonospora sp. S1-112]|uniref:Putative proline/betaine transporter n=1 Tax=Streptomonospora mangrovi TaxID=2883123 RepID=A0A9X3NJ73_9ACTN|nr:MFS transporter [Streptomonospora mangrovi]MDA0564233.1 MFS transporter [Streptomonospora mangrovi]
MSSTESMGTPAAAPPPTTPAPDRRIALRAAVAGGVGTLIEYYAFSVYGFLAVVIAPLFFPSDNPATSILATLAVFGSGYLMRPLGGIFFGRLGDRRGRKIALVSTVVSMGLCCALMGVLPTYAQVGILAPILLVVVRMAEGFSAGGEIGGSATYIAESSPARLRGFFGAFTPTGSTLGFAVAAAVAGAATGLLTDAQMTDWGWRVPFLLCVPLTLLCLWARIKLEDTPDFREMEARAEVARAPFRSVLRHRPLAVLKVVGLAVATNGTGYVGLTYMNIYLINDLGYGAQEIYWLSAAVIALACLSMPFLGALGDRVGRLRLLVAGCVGYVLLAYPIMLVMAGKPGLLLVAAVYLAFMLLNAALQVPAFPLFTELFSRAVRYTGVALGFNIGTIVAGGTAPYIAAQLVAATGDPVSPSYWVMGVAVVGLATAFTMRSATRDRLPA